ncbi:MAG: DUF554 domain-containing protein [Oscillospiraceae bacterium]|nr:DUF554 domain-containing protein [Oscillospiraceae bacterium]
MLGVLVNTLAVLCGSGVGLLCRRTIPEKLTKAVMTTIGFATLILGISGALRGENALVMILSAVFGTIIGTLLDLDGRLDRLGALIGKKYGGKSGEASIAQGFVTASLLFCIGAMTIVGSLDSGLRGDHGMIYTKSLLDLISSCVLAATLGFGVLLSAAFVLVFQGSLVLLAGILAPVLSASAISEMTCVGSLMIIALGMNIIGAGKFKVTNILPSIVLAPLFTWIMGRITV